MTQEITISVELPDELADHVERRKSEYDVVLQKNDERRNLPTGENELTES